MRRRQVMVLVFACMLAPACASAPPGPWADPETTAFAPSLGIDLASFSRLPGGIRVRDLSTGSGDPATSRSETVLHYTLFLPDGRAVQSTRGEAPLTVRLNDPSFLIREAIVGMRPGGRRTVVVPPNRGYGRRGVPGLVPPDATLVFDVELLELRP